VQDRSANELPAQTQTLRGHNSAPHATQKLWPRLNRSSQRGKHICMKIPTFLRPSFSWHQSSSGFSCGVPRDRPVQHITTLALATLRCRGRSEREWECVRRNDNELPAETQTLRGHNSAPHATQTLWPRLNRSSQRGEHICMKIPAFFASLLLLAPIVVRFLLRCSSRSTSATYHNPNR